MRDPLVSVLLLAFLLPALAGCLGDDGGPAEDVFTPPEDPMLEGADHDHADPAQHRMLWNRELVHEDRMASGPDAYAGLHALDVQAGTLFGAVWGSGPAATNGGLQIWDLSDPEAPERRGTFTIPGSVGGDRSVEATVDGDYAVLTAEALTSFGQVNPLAAVNTYLLDTRDRDLPLVADTLLTTGQTLGDPTTTHDPPPVALGQHSVTVHRIAGEDYTFVWGKIYHIDRSQDPAKLVYLGQINVGHDLYIKDTPWGDVWGLAANGYSSLQVWSLNDPADPVKVGEWDIPERQERADAGESFYLHTADAAFFDDGVVVTVNSEDWEDHPSRMWILDGSGLRDGGEVLEVLGEWTNPWGHTAKDLAFSMHTPRFRADGLMSLSHYHGGVLDLDFRDPAHRGDPRLVSYAVWAPDGGPEGRDPSETAVQEQESVLPPGHFVPVAMDQEWGPDGILYVADAANGLQVYVPAGDHPDRTGA